MYCMLQKAIGYSNIVVFCNKTENYEIVLSSKIRKERAKK